RHTAKDLPRRVALHGDVIEKLGGDIAQLLATPTVNPRSWLLAADADAARQAVVEDLLPWLDAVYLRYRGADLPPCWAYHPEVVEELLVLRAAHREAQGGAGWGTRSAAWHNMYRPAVVKRIREYAGTCDLDKHVSAGQDPLTAPGAANLDRIVEHWVTHGVPPVPTEQELQEARELQVRRLNRPS